MSDTDTERAERARARASWAVEVRRLDEMPEVELVEGAPDELIGLVYEFTLGAWAVANKRMPSYTRHEVPGRVIRPSADGTA